MNAFTRRRFMLDLAAIGGIIALTAGRQLEARPVPSPELKKKLDDAIDKAFAKDKQPPPPPPPKDPRPHYPAPGRMPAPQRPYPPSGAVAPPGPK
jgi:hypothetical protein